MSNLRWLCRLINRFKFILDGNPCIQNEFIEKYVLTSRAPKSDIAEYIKVSRQKFQYLLFFSIIIGELLYGIRYLYFGVLVYQEFHNYNPKSVERIPLAVGHDGKSNPPLAAAADNQSYQDRGQANQHVVLRFSCLVTNCTRLSSDKVLVENLAALPSFTECLPTIEILYVPFKYLEYFGLLACLVVGLGCLLIGFVGPLSHYFEPDQNELMMFLVAPQLTREIVAQNINDISENISDSLFNFKRDNSFLYTTRPASLRRKFSDYNDLYRSIAINRNQSLALPKRLSGVRCFHLSTKENADLELCLPMTRSTWWLHILERKFCLFLASTVVLATLIAIAVFTYMYLTKELKLAEYKHYAAYMRSVGCSIWTWQDETNNANNPLESITNPTSGRILHLDQYQAGWSLLNIVESMIFLFAPIYNLLSLITSFYANSIDLACWMADLRSRLALLIVMSQANVRDLQTIEQKFDLERPLDVDKSNQDERLMRSHDIIMRKYHSRFKSATKFRGLIMFDFKQLDARNEVTSSRLQSKLAHEHFVLSLMTDSQVANGRAAAHFERVFLILLTNTYINLRLFIARVEQYGSVMTIIILFSYITNLGLALIYIYIRGIISGQNIQLYAPIVLLSVVWIISNMLILIGSKFQANARKLHHLVWSLIARLKTIDVLEIQHMRALWMKQIMILDHIDGLSYRASGIRVTYTNLIQLVIWMTSLFVIALKSDN